MTGYTLTIQRGTEHAVSANLSESDMGSIVEWVENSRGCSLVDETLVPFFVRLGLIEEQEYIAVYSAIIMASSLEEAREKALLYETPDVAFEEVDLA